MATAGNCRLWRELAHWTCSRTARWLVRARRCGPDHRLLTGLLGLLAWRWTLKPVLTLLLLARAVGAHFMLTYHVVIDTTMLTNVLQTDPGEARDLLSWRLAATVAAARRRAVGAGLALALRPIALPRRLVQNLRSRPGLARRCWCCWPLPAPGVGDAQPPPRALPRQPAQLVYALGQIAAQPLRRDDCRRAADRRGRPARPELRQQAKPPLLVLVLGETGRSGNFGINGYARDTTPELARAGVASFRNAWSCGTSTAASVPCMFSHLGQEGFETRTDYEGLLDVLQRAGLAVLWVDNQSGCKGVCDRVPTWPRAPHATPNCAPTASASTASCSRAWTRASRPCPPRARKGVVVVLHQMGSHGPAYHMRSPPRLQAVPARMHQQRAAGLQPRTSWSTPTTTRSPTPTTSSRDHRLAQAPEAPLDTGDGLRGRPRRVAGREQPLPARHALRDRARRAETRALDHLGVAGFRAPQPACRSACLQPASRHAGLARQLLPFGARAARRADRRLPARSTCTRPAQAADSPSSQGGAWSAPA